MTHKIYTLACGSVSLDTLALDSKTFVVTGAAAGIGRAVTHALVAGGANVIMVDRKTRHLETLYDSLVELNKRVPVIAPLDLNEITPESVTQFAQHVYDEFGALDGVLHNAAELGSPSPMEQYDLEYWDTVMQVNAHAPYLLTRALLPLLKKSTHANVVFTTAECAINHGAYWGAYAIAYAAVEAQMQIWHEELSNVSSVKFCSVDPGAVRTVMRRRSHPGEDQGIISAPAEVAPALCYLLGSAHELSGHHVVLEHLD